MNTASRMESTGIPGKIQISHATADLLVSAGKSAWITAREDKVHAKGKGELQTYWVSVSTGKMARRDTGDTGAPDPVEDRFAIPPVLEGKIERLVQWNVDVLSNFLGRLQAFYGNNLVEERRGGTIEGEAGRLALEDGQGVPYFPSDTDMAPSMFARTPSVLDTRVREQLQDFVSCIAHTYQDNPFHNFEHASHVIMSVNKLLSRIHASIEASTTTTLNWTKENAYGIFSDPLIPFSCVFSALIHDAGHTGVLDAQFIKENPQLASLYNNKSVAANNSVYIAWDLFMEDRFSDFRAAIYRDDNERERFRHLVVNSVIATDVMDPELRADRERRWQKYFAFGSVEGDSGVTNCVDMQSSDQPINPNAMIIIEHLLQASNLAHAMQHWHVYRKWNARLFDEMYKAYTSGRSESDPGACWYESEIEFFNTHIIPLAKKLKESGVFGVSGDEYLNYAESNLKEWEERGRAVVADFVKKNS